jgi:iron complex outermembrane receptor protein
MRIAWAFAALACMTAAAAADETNATHAPRAIEEIVVTAQKKAENIQDVPISITALSGDFLKEAAVDDVNKLVHYTPNVYFQYNGPAGSAIFIRGFGTPFALSTLDPGVSLVLDELSIPRDIYLSDPLFDLDRFEVLRGPQGTLFGKNTPAGLFNVTTSRPTRELTGSITGRIGGLDTHRVEVAVGGPLGPLGDVAQFRLAAVDSDGINDVVNTKLPDHPPDVQQRAGRLSLALQPLDGLDALLIGSRATTDSPRTFTWQQRDLRPSSVTFLRQYDPKFEDDGFNHQISQNKPGDMERTTDLIQLNLRQKIPDFGPLRDLEAVAIFGKTGFDQTITSDVDMTPVDIATIEPSPFHYDQRSVELRLSGTVPAPAGWGDIEVLVGGLLFDSEFSTTATVLAGDDIAAWLLSAPGFENATGMQPPGGIGFQTLQQAAAALGVPLPAVPSPIEGDGFNIAASQDLESKAVFGQIAWHPTDRWTLSFGARANFEDKHATIQLTCFNPGVLCAASGAQSFTAHPRRSETDFSPKITLQYRPFENLALFATHAQGYKSGGFNNLSLNPAGIEVEPEKTLSWEVGAKGDLFGRSLSYGLTLFNMDVDDLQLQNYVSTTIVLVRNAASARSRGIELDLQWLTPWEPLSIRGGGALTDAVFTKYPNAPAPRGSGSPNQDLSGKRLPYAPQRQVNATPELRFPFRVPSLPFVGGRPLVFRTALDVLYRGDLFLDGDLDPKTRQDAYVLLTGRLALANADENLSLNLAVENLTNNDVMTFATDSSFFPGGYMGSQEFQRNYYVEARYRW